MTVISSVQPPAPWPDSGRPGPSPSSPPVSVRAPAAYRITDLTVHQVPQPAVDQRRNRQPLGQRHQLREELVRQRLVHVHPLDRDADLTGVGESNRALPDRPPRPDPHRGRSGVRPCHRFPGSPSPRSRPLQGDRPTGRAGTDVRDDVHLQRSASSGTDRRAPTGHLDQHVWPAGARRATPTTAGRPRGTLACLVHHRVPGDQRRAEKTAGDGDRVVPRSDDSGDAARFEDHEVGRRPVPGQRATRCSGPSSAYWRSVAIPASTPERASSTDGPSPGWCWPRVLSVRRQRIGAGHHGPGHGLAGEVRAQPVAAARARATAASTSAGVATGSRAHLRAVCRVQLDDPLL